VTCPRLKAGSIFIWEPHTIPQYEVAAEAGPGTRIPSAAAMRNAVSQMESFSLESHPGKERLDSSRLGVRGPRNEVRARFGAQPLGCLPMR
jgi:hypothetical protein